MLTFFLIMLALAALPSSSVALVVTRAATHGVPDGIAVACGIVLGDLFFIALVLLGFTVVAEMIGPVFVVLKYAGGAYLLWLGLSLIRAEPASLALETTSRPTTLLASTLAGLILTLGDLKAILFYASLFPNLFDLTTLSTNQVAVIVATTVVTVGGVKVIYALLSRTLVSRYSHLPALRHATTVIGMIVISAGIHVIVFS